MNVRYRVTLSEEERMALQEMLGKGRSQVREVKRAQILLAADQGASEDAIAKAVRTSAATIYRTKRRFVEQGLVAALLNDQQLANDLHALITNLRAHGVLFYRDSATGREAKPPAQTTPSRRTQNR